MTAAPPPQSSYNATGTLRYVLTGARHDGLDGPRNWYVDGGGCMPETAEQQWRRVRVEHGKNGSSMVTDERGTRYVGDNVQALHLILSADDSEPGGVAGVHRRNKQIADRLAEGGWQYVIGTQDDGLGGKRHSHVVFNTVHPKTGRSMSGRHPAKDINQLRKIVDEVLAEHGIDNKALHADRQQVRYSAKERAQQADGAYVWKDDLDSRLGAALAASIDRDSFKVQALDRGVEVRYHGRGLSFGFTDADDEERKIPAKALGSKWRAKNLDQRLAERAERVRAAEAAQTVDRTQTVDRERGRMVDVERDSTVQPPTSTVTRSGSFAAALGRTQPTRVAPHQPEPAQPAPVEAEPTPPLPPYDRAAAQADVPMDHGRALGKVRVKGADGEPCTVWDLTHERAERRYTAAAGRLTPAQAMDAEMNRELKDGRTLRQAAAAEAKKRNIPERGTFGNLAKKLREGQQQLNEAARQSQQRSQSRGMSM